MDDGNTFTIAFPEARTCRTASAMSAVFFVIYWILFGVALFGPAQLPDLQFIIVGTIAFGLFLGSSIYTTRKQKELAPIINRRFAAEFTAHTAHDYPPDVDILKVKRSIAVRTNDGSVFVWGVERSKDAFTVFPMP